MSCVFTQHLKGKHLTDIIGDLKGHLNAHKKVPEWFLLADDEDTPWLKCGALYPEGYYALQLWLVSGGKVQRFDWHKFGAGAID